LSAELIKNALLQTAFFGDFVHWEALTNINGDFLDYRYMYHFIFLSFIKVMCSEKILATFKK